ncbi:MAG: hypothetical protein WC817_03495 [Patescibacteria group bacterium]|jgi:hypothetical protein
MKVFIPFSPRSFEGIVRDTLAYLALQGVEYVEVIALVCEGEDGPTDDQVDDRVFVREDGACLDFIPPTIDDMVVVNGGPTQLGYAAARIQAGRHLNVQRDGVVELTEQY